jgi:pyrroline-5-carboxylate reductase
MTRPKLAFLGGGHMGEALAAGLLASGWATEPELAIVEKVEARRAALQERWPAMQLVDAPMPADGVVVAVRPPDVEAACREAAGTAPGRVLSIAAGVPIAKLEAWIGAGVPVVRAMPNQPAAVGLGASAIAPGTHASEDDLTWAEGVLSAVGVVVRVDERALDAVTGLSGSGPAYVFLVAEAMIAAGVANGLSPEHSAVLAVQTILGAGRLLADSGQSPEALRKAVATPGGTTAAALAVLEAGGLRQLFEAAITAATERARELGGG